MIKRINHRTNKYKKKIGKPENKTTEMVLENKKKDKRGVITYFAQH